VAPASKLPRDLKKLIDNFQPKVEEASRHDDMGTVTGEEVVMFTLAKVLAFREVKKSQENWHGRTHPSRG
jgi:hypothetical protein